MPLVLPPVEHEYLRRVRIYASDRQQIFLAYLYSIYKQVHNYGFSFLASFDGRHRSGKSITAITWASILDRSFYKEMEHRMPQEPKEFVDIIEGRIAKRGQKGAVVVVDEAGVTMSSSDWYEKWMKTIVKLVQMFGYLCPVIFFVAPVKDFVDSRLRKMFHAYYSVRRYSNNCSVILPYHLKYSTLHKKPIYAKPVLHYVDQRITIDQLIMGRPPEQIIERYKELELSRKNAMLAKFVSELKQDEIKEAKQTADLDKIVQTLVEDYQFYQMPSSTPDNIKLDAVAIELAFKVPARIAKHLKRLAEQKLNSKERDSGESEVKNS